MFELAINSRFETVEDCVAVAILTTADKKTRFVLRYLREVEFLRTYKVLFSLTVLFETRLLDFMCDS